MAAFMRVKGVKLSVLVADPQVYATPPGWSRLIEVPSPVVPGTIE